MTTSDGGDMLMKAFGQMSPAPCVEMCGALIKDANLVSSVF